MFIGVLLLRIKMLTPAISDGYQDGHQGKRQNAYMVQYQPPVCYAYFSEQTIYILKDHQLCALSHLIPLKL